MKAPRQQARIRNLIAECEKVQHVIMLNLARRHLEPYQWGLMFKKYLAAKGVKRGSGGDRTGKKQTVTVSVCAKECGVDDRTARRRLAQADQYEALPKPLKKQVDAKEVTLPQAARVQKEAKREARRAENRQQVAKAADPGVTQSTACRIEPDSQGIDGCGISGAFYCG